VEQISKQVILAGVLALMASSTAFAQASQGQSAAQAGVNGNAATAPDSTMKREEMHGGTGGMTTGTGARNPDGSPTSMPKAQDSPTGRTSQGQTAPK